MPYPPSQRRSPGPRRRSLLASAAGAALLTACSPGSDDASRAERDGGAPSAAERSRARAARDSAALLERYDAVLAVHPAFAVRLAPLRAEVLRHVEAFGGAGATASPSAPSPAGTSPLPSVPPSAAASGQPSAAPVPADPRAALAALAAAERTLADARTTQLLGVPGEQARLLASVAAAGAAHVYLLTEGAQ
ncbi:hypothetical protein [Streptomyces galbus]|uniref:Lipoprotein n=1 Tax=Streptomyces galbus TaxID=33898 RepID=A0ABX1INS0_STRGB|nr:hypothetical protein [Streptomyces galbus]NKQ27052.1 hypothetical protein [Streptomyces galbus]